MQTFKVKHLRKRKNKLATPKHVVANDHGLTLETLKNAVERSTSANRNFFISFLIVLLYLMVIVASTTDYQLLIPNSKVKLPFVDVDVSLILFYLLAPIIVLVGHFNMLQNLESHHYKLEAWQAAYQGKPVPRALIEPFLYDYALLELDGQLTKAVRFFSRLLFLFLSPVVLLIFLWRFSDYQSLNITFWHLVLLLADMLIIAHFQRAISRRWRISKLGLLITLLAVSETLLLGFILKPETTKIWILEKKVLDSKRLSDLYNQTFEPINFAKANSTPAQETKSIKNSDQNVSENLLSEMFQTLPQTIFSLVLPRISIDHTVSLTLDDKLSRTQMAFDGETDFSKWFNKQKDNGWDLRGRNLKGAQLEHADLRHVLLKKAHLEGANLSYAKLHRANLSDSQLQGANLNSAQLQDANLFNTKLQGADLPSAKLHNAYLYNAKLQGAKLLGSQLQGADLDSAHLEGAKLFYAQLQDASLVNAKLQGASLANAQLQGANLEKAQLQGANLANVQLQGANLANAQLQGANLEKAQLQGGNLEKAQLQGANLEGAKLHGANLWWAHLQGAKLWSAQLQGAKLNYSRLQGALLSDAKLQGANLTGVFLKGAILEPILDSELKVQSAAQIDMHYDDTDWGALKALNLNAAFNERIDLAFSLVKDAKKTDEHLFKKDETSLAMALPKICDNNYYTLQGSLEGLPRNSLTEDEVYVWQELPLVTECKPHLEKIKQWGLERYKNDPKKQKQLIPEDWPNNKRTKTTLKPIEKPALTITQSSNQEL